MSLQSPARPHLSLAARCHNRTLVFVPSIPRASAPGADTPVLVVAHDPVEAAKLATRVFKRGHAVALACDATEAIAMMKVARFELILADSSMPGREGLRWVEQIVHDPHGPAVALIASESATSAVEAASLPLAGYFTGTISDEQLDGLLGRLLSREPLS